MKIRERQLAYAFALVENAKNTLYTATQVIGNTLRYGKDGDIRDEILGAAKTLENARLKMEEVMDANTDWSDDKRVPFVRQSAVGANETFRLLCDMERSDK